MHREGGRETASLALCNSLPLLPSTHPGNNPVSPKYHSLLAVLHLQGKESAENIAPIPVVATSDGTHVGATAVQKLPLAATTAASSDGGSDSLCML